LKHNESTREGNYLQKEFHKNIRLTKEKQNHHHHNHHLSHFHHLHHHHHHHNHISYTVEKAAIGKIIVIDTAVLANIILKENKEGIDYLEILKSLVRI
jgi:hypothetical protein